MIRRGLVTTLLLLGALRAQDAVPRLAVSYTVTVADPESGSIRVVMSVEENTQEDLIVALPAWAPGAYRLVKYAKAVRNLAGHAGDRDFPATAMDDELSWKIHPGRAARFTLSYELAVEKLRLDKDHCFLAGPDTYLYLSDHKDAPCRVRFEIPEEWRVGTALTREGETYRARDYDTFIDCPTELGRFELVEFTTDQTTYQLVIHAKGPVDGEKLAQMCRRVVREQNRVFGKPPFDRYVFFYHLRDGFGGRGLEHLNSTDIVLPYPAIRQQPMVAASMTSHEYFHLWNVKRIRPFELGPFDYSGMVRSKALWMCEGVTSYFGDRGLVRAGIWTEDAYLAHLSEEVATLQNNSDRKVTSVEKASQSVWDRKDWPRVDYYNKGELLGLLIDLRLRESSAGTKSLDDVLRLLYDRYVRGPSKAGKGPIGVGYGEDGIRRALEEISGKDWKPFYTRYISGTEELPYEEILGDAGLDITLKVTTISDLGGADLRFTFVAQVPGGSEADKAGLKPGDRVTFLNDVEVNRNSIQGEMAKLHPGDEVKVRLLRGTEVVDVTVHVGSHERTTCRLRRAESPTEAQKSLLEGWLTRPADY